MLVSYNENSLNNGAQNIDSYISSYNSDIKKAEEIITRMNEAWKDSTYDNYKEKMLGFFDELGIFGQVLDNNNEFLHNYLKAGQIIRSSYGSQKIG